MKKIIFNTIKSGYSLLRELFDPSLEGNPFEPYRLGKKEKEITFFKAKLNYQN